MCFLRCFYFCFGFLCIPLMYLGCAPLFDWHLLYILVYLSKNNPRKNDQILISESVDYNIVANKVGSARFK